MKKMEQARKMMFLWVYHYDSSTAYTDVTETVKGKRSFSEFPKNVGGKERAYFLPSENVILMEECVKHFSASLLATPKCSSMAAVALGPSP